MKNLAPAFPDQQDGRRVRKPLMEKRRRDRINHSLESLRRLLLENTRNEKLKNPKVEKAEILESVVDFLRTEQEGEQEHQPLRGGQLPSCKARHSYQEGMRSYQEGMRSCLLRVSRFMATKSQQLEDTADTSLQTSMGLPGFTRPPTHVQFHLASTSTSSPVATPGQLRQLSPVCPASRHHKALGLSRPTQRTGLSDCTSSSRQSPPPSPYMELTDSVWRPWPQ